METLNIAEKKDKIKWDYDAEADVLYISFGNPKNAEGVDIGDGTIVRIQSDSREIIGFTILNPLHRTLSSLSGKKHLNRKKRISISLGPKAAPAGAD
ncbi:MAG: DUF2283 domain-containing protein [Prolixibacteraceae bacterium]